MSYKSSGKKKKWHNHNILTIPKGNNMELRFGYSDFNNRHRLDIRQWVQSESGTMIPTKAGLSIPFSELDSFMTALQQSIPQIQEYATKKFKSTSSMDL